MIYTLTMNPAVDYVMTVPSLETGGVSRSGSPCGFIAAGKGVNVSDALAKIAVGNVAVCLCGEGFVADEFVRRIRAREQSQGQKSVIIRSSGCDTRLNVKVLRCEGDGVTEVNGFFRADNTAADRVRDKLRELLKDGDFLVMSGSLPDGVSSDFYAETAAELSAEGVTVIVDASGEPLRKAAAEKGVWLIKPNESELRELRELREIGGGFETGRFNGVNVLATFGEKGAVLTCGEGEYVCRPPKVLKGYTVGAGDTLLAGFTADYAENRDFEKALYAGVRLAGRAIINN